jgi:hypothetical protein
MQFKWLLLTLASYFVNSLTQKEVYSEYEKYLNLFNKKESINSFSIFSENYRRVYAYNYYQNRYYLTQHSDERHDEFISLPHMYVYLLGSRKGKELLICS